MNETFINVSAEQDALFDIYETSEGVIKSFGVDPEELFEWAEYICKAMRKNMREISFDEAMLSVTFYAFVSGMIYQKKLVDG